MSSPRPPSPGPCKPSTLPHTSPVAPDPHLFSLECASYKLAPDPHLFSLECASHPSGLAVGIMNMLTLCSSCTTSWFCASLALHKWSARASSSCLHRQGGSGPVLSCRWHGLMLSHISSVPPLPWSARASSSCLNRQGGRVNDKANVNLRWDAMVLCIACLAQVVGQGQQQQPRFKV